MKLESSKILVVDDTPNNIDLLVDLIGEKYELSVALDGETALELAEEVRPDLILLDIMMPGMDGYETCEKLKENPHLKEIPIIFLTAKTAPEDIIKGLNLGAVDYVTKPFNVAELEARVHTHLELKYNREKVQAQAKKIQAQFAEQKELLHVLCHDLQNPLGNISSFLELMEMNPEMQETGLQIIKKASSHGLEIIELVRKMRALEEKRLTLESVKLGLAMAESASMLQRRLEEKQLILDVRDLEGLVVWAEQTSLINSVLNNLLTNAIKFSHPGGVIEVFGALKGGEVFLSVKDHGVGMPEALRKDLFDINKSTSRAGTNNESGTGFGMPLVQKFMHAYGGDLQVESKDQDEFPEDHGTLIRLRFVQRDQPTPTASFE